MNHPIDPLELARLAAKDIRDIESVLFWIAIPLALIPPVPRSWRWMGLRTLAITIAVWYVLIRYHGYYEVGWSQTVWDMEDPNSGYDGVGGNVAILCLGWVFPFVECLGVLILCRYLFPWLASLWGRMTGKADSRKAAVHETPVP